jgi:hypothetical protein
MDWKLDRQRREKNQNVVKKEAARKLDIMDEMEREFSEIFGEDRKFNFASEPCRNKEAVGALRTTRIVKAPKADWAPDLD